jgi:uncharacterized protein YcbX
MVIEVGTIVELNRYPVKSMAGERLTAAELRWQGLAGDRQYSFFRANDLGRFPWLSARDLSRLVLYRPSFGDPGDPRRSAVEVTTPEGDRLPLDSPELRSRLSEEAGEDLRLLQVGRGTYDAMPVSLATTATHAAVDAVHGATLDPRRYRSNIVVDAPDREIAWTGRLLQIGGDDGPRLLVNDAIPRCALITIDPDTSERDPEVMRTVAQRFDNAVGVYCATARPGIIRVGDTVRLIGVDQNA